jgi:hypothetical protein
MEFAELKNGRDVLSQITLRPNNLEEPHPQTIPPSVKERIYAAIVPDRHSVPLSALSEAVRFDAQDLKSEQSVSFVSSRSIMKSVRQHTHWNTDTEGHHQWTTGACNRVTPDIVQLYVEGTDAGIERLLVVSEYLWNCEKHSLN